MSAAVLATELEDLKTEIGRYQTEITNHQTAITEAEAGLAAAQARIKELTKDLCKALGVPYTAPKGKSTKTEGGKTRSFTPEAIERIRAGQRNRWAKYNQKKEQEQAGSASVAAGATTPTA